MRNDDQRALPHLNPQMTPGQLVDEISDIEAMATYGTVRVIDTTDNEVAGKQVELVTGGWSENEQLIAELRMTTFHVMWWQSSHRGGLHVYFIPDRMWGKTEMLSDFNSEPGEGSRTSGEPRR